MLNTYVFVSLYPSVCSTLHYEAWFPVMGQGLGGSESKGLWVFIDLQEKSGQYYAEILLGSYGTWYKIIKSYRKS